VTSLRSSSRHALDSTGRVGYCPPAIATLVPRNNFAGKPVHRADVRFQQSVKFGSRRGADLIAEVFNLFNRANYGSYTTQESSPRYGLPNASSNLAYAPRTLQLGFRLTF